MMEKETQRLQEEGEEALQAAKEDAEQEILKLQEKIDKVWQRMGARGVQQRHIPAFASVEAEIARVFRVGGREGTGSDDGFGGARGSI